MSVLIKGMEKPEHCGYCRFRYDGICHALQKTQYNMNECPLVVIDDAGLNDTISRQAAIDVAIQSTMDWDGMFIQDANCRIRDAINELPSAQPEQRWIPVSERLPEYGIQVLTTDKDGDFELNHIIDEDDEEWFFDGAIAWCELPEPWKGDSDG